MLFRSASAAYAAYAAASYAARLRLAHRAIDTFQTATRHADRTPNIDRTTVAYEQMSTVH